ncbi:MAG: methionine adenosyltransferase [Dehalococcoidia bacterium]|nr:methionine adenosyltransferase [Dehalococcoidia bacterium]
MSTTFAISPRHLHTSESVTEGHPDKLCDQIADAILDAIIEQDPMARVACEAAATTGLLFVFGEITTHAYVDFQALARRTIRDIGYTKPHYGFDHESVGVIVSVKEQSSDIKSGVDHAWERRVGDEELAPDLDVGAGDQGHMIGFACNETAELMPLPISLAHRLVRRLTAVRKDGTLAYLGPDGKSQVTIEYNHGRAGRIDAVVISSQHDPEVSQEQIRQDVIREVIRPILEPTGLYKGEDNTRIFVNPSGRFVLGGPAGDSGLTGRKNIVDTYGSAAKHGGGSYSGKDPTKVDRTGSYAARWVAKNIVASGLAERAEVELSYAIGVAEPISISVEAWGTHAIEPHKITDAVSEVFDLRPGAVIRELGLRRPIYLQTAAYGHFGRPDLDLPWENTSKAAHLARAAGIPLKEPASA